jgi:hypothetical protein
MYDQESQANWHSTDVLPRYIGPTISLALQFLYANQFLIPVLEVLTVAVIMSISAAN